jgi:hypothetical protein
VENNQQGPSLDSVISAKVNTALQNSSILNEILSIKVENILRNNQQTELQQSLLGKVENFINNTENLRKINNESNSRSSAEKSSQLATITTPPPKEDTERDKSPLNFGGETNTEISPKIEYAFKIIPTTTGGENPQPAIKISYGEVNQLPPSNMGDLFTPSSGSVYLDISFANNGNFSGSSIGFGSLPQNTPTRVAILIGRITLLNDPPSYIVNLQAIHGNIIVRRNNVCFLGNPAVEFLLVANIAPVVI